MSTIFLICDNPCYSTTYLDFTEVDPPGRSVSAAGPFAKDRVAIPAGHSPVMAWELKKLYLSSPPLERDDRAGRPPWPTAWPRD